MYVLYVDTLCGCLWKRGGSGACAAVGDRAHKAAGGGRAGTGGGRGRRTGVGGNHDRGARRGGWKNPELPDRSVDEDGAGHKAAHCGDDTEQYAGSAAVWPFPCGDYLRSASGGTYHPSDGCV